MEMEIKPSSKYLPSGVLRLDDSKSLGYLVLCPGESFDIWYSEVLQEWTVKHTITYTITYTLDSIKKYGFLEGR